MKRRGFTLVELIAALAVVAVLAAVLMPALAGAREGTRQAACAMNLRQMYAAYAAYLQDHDGQFFPWREDRPDGILWYWGLERSGGGGEGRRAIDRTQARLAPYLGVGTVETCPSFSPYSPFLKRKFETATYGYGINVYLLANMPESRRSGVTTFGGIARPAETIVWADAAQVNMFQPPASPSNPMLEEWYYVAARPNEFPTYHFRHDRSLNAVFGDGHVDTLRPSRLLSYCDGQVGYLEPAGSDHYLMTGL